MKAREQPGRSGTSLRGQTLGVGVVGCGEIAYWTHLRILERMRGVRLVAACDPEPSSRQRAAKLVSAAILESSDELLALNDVQAVVICTPNPTHAGLGIAALEQGKHLYLEKPIATNAEDAQRLVEVAERSDRIARVGFSRRRHPVFEQARALIARGRIGKIRAVQMTFAEPLPSDQMPEWRKARSSGGGVLFDLASHHIDLLRWLLNDEIVEVSGRLYSERTEHDTAWLQLSMQQGVEASGFYSFNTGRADVIELFGEHGTLRLDRHRTQVSLRLSRRFGYGVRDVWIPPSSAALRWRFQRLLRPSVESSFERALASFANQCRGDSDSNQLASMVDGARSLEVVLAAEHSAESGHRVNVREAGS